MKKIRLILEYDGTNYAGWQCQANGLSVQEVVEAALAQIAGEKIRVIASGRTDAGVHARALPVHFRTGRDLPLRAFREGMNRLLPADVAVREATEVPADFHARHSARGKWYRYTVLNSPTRSPLLLRTAWHIRTPLDLEAMHEGAAALVGRHDFAAFRAANCDAKDTVREIFSVQLCREGELLHFDVQGDGFLRNMVRVIVGTLVEIGRGKRPAADIARLLQERKRPAAGVTAPAHGLCLMRVWYD